MSEQGSPRSDAFYAYAQKASFARFPAPLSQSMTTAPGRDLVWVRIWWRGGYTVAVFRVVADLSFATTFLLGPTPSCRPPVPIMAQQSTKRPYKNVRTFLLSLCKISITDKTTEYLAEPFSILTIPGGFSLYSQKPQRGCA